MTGTRFGRIEGGNMSRRKVLLALIVAWTWSGHVAEANDNGSFESLGPLFLDDSPEMFEFNLLDAVPIPLRDPKTQYVDESEDGFPAFGFRAGADVKMAYKQILPDVFSEEFAILINAKPMSRNGGFVFAIVNSMESIVELGVRIAPENDTSTVLSLYYTDVTSEVASHILANFTVPKFSHKWTKFAFRVTVDNVTLFFNCSETDTVTPIRKPLRLSFESASALYLAQAGPVIGGEFEVGMSVFFF
ncbi:hypothetical protein ABEB36_001680 [Hypothenemus hampei]|uniref:Thrombospondin-like N-terminal domain-containing protein n=1 Tax=Hypothenemus hampei TaxID=57062 RepID=A0ABD1FFE7_HYPHA